MRKILYFLFREVQTERNVRGQGSTHKEKGKKRKGEEKKKIREEKKQSFCLSFVY